MTTRWVGAAVAAVVMLAGCSSPSDDGKTAGPSASAKAPSVDQALAKYERVTLPGCEGYDECRAFMNRKVDALHDVRLALQAEDRGAYTFPIMRIRRAERLAAEYGRANLGSRLARAQVSEPAQEAIYWLDANR